MKPFLYYVAKDLIGRYGNNLSEVTVVFPGKRAELYMNQFLSYIAQGPVWAPRFITIDELFQQFSPLSPSETILNVCTLYHIYSQLVTEPKSLDDFYGWGEILMNDFDDIDKHMVNAEKLFTNTADLIALEQVDYLSDHQIKALRDFFTNFDPQHQTDLKQRFLEMWRVMPEMYRQLKEELRKEGLMYKGALYREVAERMAKDKVHPSHIYCFVGFNVLDEVETTLFSALRDNGKALFYWDYDVFYVSVHNNHEAGLFLRNNLKLFPNALSVACYDNLISPDKRIRMLSTSTDNAQVRYLSQWLGEHPEQEATAIILCDEALMRPALHSIPDNTLVNITMGYPLTDTAIQGYFSALIDLQVEGYDADMQKFRPKALERLEKNPFFVSFPTEHRPFQYQADNLSLINWLIDAIEALGKSLADTEAPSPYNQLYAETTFQLYKILGQFQGLIADGTLDVKPTTLRRLIRQSLAITSIPFHGEAEKGVQMMGLLEARNLDFQHLIMLSVGEGIIPRRVNDTSLIPYILRAHFGLDTTERQDAVYAYSFYRLIQRAEDITLVYNGNSSGAAQREQSRFLRQLETETDLPIERLTSSQCTVPPIQQAIAVEKDERIMGILRNKEYLSPTAINQYIDCPLKFYYQQVANIRIPERPQDGIDAPLFGTLFHDTCEHFYRHLCQQTGRKEVLRSDLEPYIQTPLLLTPHLDAAFGEIQCHAGVNMIIRDVIQKLVVQLLRWDMEHTPFTMVGLEKDVRMSFSVPSGEHTIKLNIGGRIDRMDIMDVEGRRSLRIVDYKTGKIKTGPKDIAGIFSSHASNAHGYFLQTLLYALIVSRQYHELPVCPSLFYVLSATDATTYAPYLKLGKETITDVRDYAEEYTKGLEQVLAQIYDPTRPFVQTEDAQNRCQSCDFRLLCSKNQ